MPRFERSRKPIPKIRRLGEHRNAPPLQEGDVARLAPFWKKALGLSPDLARRTSYYSGVLRQEGDYEGGRSTSQKGLTQYPRDRVAVNNLGRILFLQRKYSEAVKVLQQVLAIDPRIFRHITTSCSLQRSGRRENGKGTSGAVFAL